MQKQKLRSSFSRHHSNPYTRVRIYESGRRGCKEIENDAVFAREHYRLPGPFNEAPYVLVRMLPDAFSRIDERVKHRQLPVHTASSSSSSSRVIVHPDPSSSSYRGHSFLVDRPWRIFESFRTGGGEMILPAFASSYLHHARTPSCTVIIPFCSTVLAGFLGLLGSSETRLMVIANVGFPLICMLLRARLDRWFLMVREGNGKWQ